MRDEWKRDAACRSMDPDLFFPARGQKDKEQAAKEVCAGCTVQLSCRFAASRMHELGVWGGTTELDRTKAARKRKLMERMEQDGNDN